LVVFTHGKITGVVFLWSLIDKDPYLLMQIFKIWQDDLDSAIASLQDKNAQADASANVELDDGPGKYKMVGMISHIGKNTGSGHYVAHIKRDGKWVIFNDEKVALSENPPIPHAYLYLYQRVDTMES
jgi:ubiquitin carboxyl-terminal hydrolase 5/13